MDNEKKLIKRGNMSMFLDSWGGQFVVYDSSNERLGGVIPIGKYDTIAEARNVFCSMIDLSLGLCIGTSNLNSKGSACRHCWLGCIEEPKQPRKI